MSYFSDFQDACMNVVCTIDAEKLNYEAMIKYCIGQFYEIKQKGHLLYFIGNGGSAGISMHMTSDYLKNGGIRTHSMHDSAVITCLGNDFGYEYIFSKQLEIIARAGDLLVAISSSGNSPNILNAVMVAKDKGCKTLTFSGFSDKNELRKLGDCNIYVPNSKYGIVESIHNMILQQIVDEIVSS